MSYTKKDKSKTISVNLPLKKSEIVKLRSGDKLLLNGTLIVARDAAHKRLTQAYESEGKFPIDLTDQIIYYMGPSPTPPGFAIGAAGPTTSHRMDAYAPLFYENGLSATIGKGIRGDSVIESIIKNDGLYLCAIGGAGALYQNCIIEQEIILYKDLGPEAVRRIKVKDFPVIVAIDSFGNNLYTDQIEIYKS